MEKINTAKVKTALVGKRKTIVIMIASIIVLAVVVVIFASAGKRSESIDLNSADQNSANPNNSVTAQTVQTSNPIAGDGDYDYTEALDHIGEKAKVSGTVQKVFVSKTGTVFFDFCDEFATCPFTVVVFAGDAPKFKDMQGYSRKVTISGLIKSYQGRAEIVVSDPEQIQ